MNLLIFYNWAYSKSFSILLLLSYAYILICMVLVVATSDMSVLMIVPVGLTGLVITQIFLQKNWLNLMLGCLGVVISGWLLLGSMEVYQDLAAIPVKQTKLMLKSLCVFLPFSIASFAILLAPLFQADATNAITPPQ